MRDCRRHPSQSQPSGGVCASCLQERLVWLWRGESFRLDDGSTSATAASQHEGDGDAPPPRPLQQGVGSLASVRKQLQVNGVAKPEIGDSTDNGEDGDAAATTTTTTKTGKKPSVIVEWAEFHARRRRRNSEQGSDTSSSVPMAQTSRSLDSVEFKPLVERLMNDVDIADRSQVSISGKIRSRSMPLDNRSAEETALRVIREVQADRLYTDELDFLDAVEGGLKIPEQQQPRRLSCIWHASNSPKWVMKLLVSPVTTSRNKKKVFPSRVGTRKRLTRFHSSDWSHPDANGETHWMGSALRAKAGVSQNPRKVDEVDRLHHRRTITTMRSSMLSWLQDADRRKHEPAGLRSFSSSSSGATQLWLRDLTTVGHLHEIAEELEIVEESELEDEATPTDSLGAMSFGNFLRSAAQRQPQAGLTRLSCST